MKIGFKGWVEKLLRCFTVGLMASMAIAASEGRAAVFNITANAADGVAAIFGPYNTNFSGGLLSGYGENFNAYPAWKPIFAFEIPTVPAGQAIVGASLQFNASKTVPVNEFYGIPVDFNSDLRGLGYRVSPAIQFSDIFASSTLIYNDLLTPSSALGLIDTNAAVDGAILNYVQAQIAAGAQPGSFLLFRFDSDRSTDLSQNPDTGYRFQSSETGSGPVLTLTTAAAVPEPSTLVLASIALLAAWGCRRKLQ